MWHTGWAGRVTVPVAAALDWFGCWTKAARGSARGDVHASVCTDGVEWAWGVRTGVWVQVQGIEAA